MAAALVSCTRDAWPQQLLRMRLENEVRASSLLQRTDGNSKFLVGGQPNKRDAADALTL